MSVQTLYLQVSEKSKWVPWLQLGSSLLLNKSVPSRFPEALSSWIVFIHILFFGREFFLIIKLLIKYFGSFSTEILYQTGIFGRSYMSRYECCLYEGYPALIQITCANLETLIFLAHTSQQSVLIWRESFSNFITKLSLIGRYPWLPWKCFFSTEQRPVYPPDSIWHEHPLRKCRLLNPAPASLGW